MIMRSFPCSRSTQDGMALIVSLVFLLLMTLIGISSMQNATLQEKMAGSVKFRNESFQAAEAALRIGESAVSESGYTLAKCAGAPTEMGCHRKRPVWRPADLHHHVDRSKYAMLGSVHDTVSNHRYRFFRP
jgi:Tfp pilus assembly protein PilX